MHVKLTCSNCGESSLVPFATLYKVWKQGYDSMCEHQKPEAKVRTDIQYHCGNKDTYNSPMFQYMFQLVFEECIKDL